MQTKTCKCGQTFETNYDAEECLYCFEKKLPTPFDRTVDMIFEQHKLNDPALRETIKTALQATFCAGQCRR